MQTAIVIENQMVMELLCTFHKSQVIQTVKEEDVSKLFPQDLTWVRVKLADGLDYDILVAPGIDN